MIPKTWVCGILFGLGGSALLPAQATTASVPTLPELASRIGSSVTWQVTDPWILEEGRNRAEVEKNRGAAKDFDRIAAIDQALAIAKEKNRPVLWYIPRIASGVGGRQMYRPALLDTYAQAVLFTDPTLADVLNRRFVMVRLACDKRLGDRFGIVAPETVEPAIVFLDAEGKTLRKLSALRSFNAAWLENVLRDVLAAHPSGAGLTSETAKIETEATDSPERRTRLAQSLLRDGDLSRALSTLGDMDAVAVSNALSARWALLRAEAHRRLGALEAAHVQLDIATKWILSSTPAEIESESQGFDEDEEPRRGPASKPDLRSDLACERGRILLLQGKVAEARLAFAEVKRGERRTEAQYHLGLAHLFDRNESMALQRWKSLIAADPESAYAARSANHLLDGQDRVSAGPALHGFEDPFAPAPSSSTSVDTTVPVAAGKHEELARRAIRFLLRNQRENGGWTDSRYAYWPSHELTPNAWVAATAVATAGLLAWRDLDPVAIDAAVRDGERYLLDERKMNRGFNEEIYADSYKLTYLATKHGLAKTEEERARIVELMNGIVRELQRTQMSGEGEGRRRSSPGFWSHEYPNPFSTAAVMNCLEAARRKGATVPARLFEDGSKALLSVRNSHGAYSYGAGRAPREGGDFGLKDSMARSPICEAALIWAGSAEGSPDKLGSAMDNFWKYWPRLEAVRRCDFHTDGELAGFFFWHAMYHTSEALDALPVEARVEHRQKLYEQILRLGEIDGSFLDSHEMGKGYATGIALLTLKNLLPQP